VRQRIAVPATWDAAHLEVVAFVQDRRTGVVLQAVSLPSCPEMSR